MIPNSETRAVPGKVELRDAAGKSMLAGTGIEWDVWSVDLGGFRERFAPNSVEFDADFRVVNQHDGSQVFGRLGAGTARLTMDPVGAHYEADPPDAQWARDAMASIARGDIYQNSFRFSIAEPVDQNQEWVMGTDGVMERTVKKAKVYEMGPQTDPAYPNTMVMARGLEEARARLARPMVPAAVVEEQSALRARILAGFDAGA